MEFDPGRCDDPDCRCCNPQRTWEEHDDQEDEAFRKARKKAKQEMRRGRC